MSRPVIDPVVRFQKFVRREGTHLIWIGMNNGCGYGQFWDGKQRVYAHRFSYEQVYGLVSDGFELDHLCRVTLCVEPTHLEPVTHAENIRRGAPTGYTLQAIVNKAKTHCPAGHEYSEENTQVHKIKGDRACRQCKRDSYYRSKMRQA